MDKEVIWQQADNNFTISRHESKRRRSAVGAYASREFHLWNDNKWSFMPPKWKHAVKMVPENTGVNTNDMEVQRVNSLLKLNRYSSVVPFLHTLIRLKNSSHVFKWPSQNDAVTVCVEPTAAVMLAVVMMWALFVSTYDLWLLLSCLASRCGRFRFRVQSRAALGSTGGEGTLEKEL